MANTPKMELHGLRRPRFTIVDPVKSKDQTYTAPIATAAGEFGDVTVIFNPALAALPDLLASADMVWIDWCVEHAVIASRLNQVRRKPLFIRLHAFEVLEGKFVNDVCWENVTCLIAVSRDVQQLALQQARRGPRVEQTCVIPNGIDISRYQPSGANDPLKIAWVGVLAPKKNPFLALHVLAELKKRGGRHRLYIAGEEVNPRSVRHLVYLVKRLKLEKDVDFCGHVFDMASWYRNKGVLLSTSLYESFGFAIGEAAASGLRPVVFDFPNADELWPANFIVSSIAEACDAVMAGPDSSARSYVIDRYPLQKQLASLHLLLRDGLRGR